MTEENLKHYVGVLFRSGYRSLAQQHIYWERLNNVEIPIVYQTISKINSKQ